MSIRLKLNIRNVILGCHNFGDILARHNTRLYSGFSRLAATRVIELFKSTKPCSYFRQDNVRRNTLNHAKAVLPRGYDSIPLKRITSEVPLISKRIDKVHTGRISNPGGLLPWKSPIRSYYERKNPQCPPPRPKVHKDCCDPPVPPCPPIAKPPICPVERKCGPCKRKKDPCTKMTPCCLKTSPLHNCTLYSASPHQPKHPSSRPKKSRFCKPKREVFKPVPKCPSPAYSGRPPPTTKAKKRGCEPKLGLSGGGEPCTGAPQPRKECHHTPGHGANSGGAGKMKPVCPPSKSDNPCGDPCAHLLENSRTTSNPDRTMRNL